MKAAGTICLNYNYFRFTQSRSIECMKMQRTTFCLDRWLGIWTSDVVQNKNTAAVLLLWPLRGSEKEAMTQR